MLRKIKSHLAVFLMLALAFTLLIPAPVQAASKKKPVKVTVTSVKTSGTNKVVVKWRKVKYATNYRIYWRQAGTKKWRTLATVKSNKTTYTHKSNNKARLVAGKKYVYTVRAYNKYGKKWGSYNPKGKTVMIPKKKAAPPATAPVKPKPTTQTPAKPTATPVPAKPTEAPRPTATPIPAKPTEAPKPTATPAPVKVSNVTVNPATVKLTSKGQTTQLSATVLPSNAENKSIVWSTSNASVATVDNNGVVTAVANGNATITAAAADGSGKSGNCSVTVEIQDESSQLVELAGGESTILSVWNEDYDENIDVEQISFEYTNTNDCFSISGKKIFVGKWSRMTIKAQRQGSCVVLAKYNGRVLKKWTINVTSDWSEYVGYVNWRKQVESQIWTNGMSVKEKCDAAQGYIKTQFTYKSGYGQAVLIYNDKMCDCIGASDLMGGFAKDANAQIKYCSNRGTQPHDYLADATSEGGHTFTMILIDGKWVSYDAQP
jgi:Bacterial surface proteins containing Ig-like domains